MSENAQAPMPDTQIRYTGSHPIEVALSLDDALRIVNPGDTISVPTREVDAWDDAPRPWERVVTDTPPPVTDTPPPVTDTPPPVTDTPPPVTDTPPDTAPIQESASPPDTAPDAPPPSSSQSIQESAMAAAFPFAAAAEAGQPAV